MKKAKFGYIWVTLALFVIALTGHWIVGWHTHVQEQKERGQPPQLKTFVMQTARDTLENWQSEFLQLVWQVAGLSFLWCVGSPQSKEGDERREEKLDALLRMLSPEAAEKLLAQLDEKYPRK